MLILDRNDDCPKGLDLHPGCEKCSRCEFYGNQMQESVTLCNYKNLLIQKIKAAAAEIADKANKTWVDENKLGEWEEHYNEITEEEVEDIIKRHLEIEEE